MEKNGVYSGLFSGKWEILNYNGEVVVLRSRSIRLTLAAARFFATSGRRRKASVASSRVRRTRRQENFDERRNRPVSNANEENNELDDLFMKADDSDGNDDFFASLNGSQNDAGDSDPFAAFNAPSDDESVSIETVPDADFGDFGNLNAGGAFEENSSSESLSIETDETFDNWSASESSDPFENANAAPDDASAPVAGKKGKKGKAPKAKKEKGAKASKTPKVKKAKAAKSDVRYGSTKPFVLLGALFLLGILVANAFAVMNADKFQAAGTNLIVYLIVFDLLGALLLAIPAMLIKQLKTRAVRLFDVLLALVAAFVTMAAMTFLTYQAKTYGFPSSKVASTVSVSTFDVRA